MILPDARAALTTQIAGTVTCPFRPVNPGEDTPLRECVWVRKVVSRFEWRSLGIGPAQHRRNRTETLAVDLQVHVYREGPNQAHVAAAALDRCEEILAEVEAAIDGDQTLGGLLSFARVADCSAELLPRDSGWTATGLIRVEAQNYPA